MKLAKGFEKYPEATLVSITHRSNGSGIGPDDIATYTDRDNLFRKIHPKTFGEEDITDTDLW